MARLDLLKVIEDHLRDGNLGHEVFDFDCINRGTSDLGLSCGTNGCAMGELPIIFPKEWRFEPGEGVALKDSKHLGLAVDVCTFLGINREEMEHLFFPDMQKPIRFGGGHLGRQATRVQVADNIDDFISMKESS